MRWNKGDLAELTIKAVHESYCEYCQVVAIKGHDKYCDACLEDMLADMQAEYEIEQLRSDGGLY